MQPTPKQRGWTHTQDFGAMRGWVALDFFIYLFSTRLFISGSIPIFPYWSAATQATQGPIRTVTTPPNLDWFSSSSSSFPLWNNQVYFVLWFNGHDLTDSIFRSLPSPHTCLSCCDTWTADSGTHSFHSLIDGLWNWRILNKPTLFPGLHLLLFCYPVEKEGASGVSRNVENLERTHFNYRCERIEFFLREETKKKGN